MSSFNQRQKEMIKKLKAANTKEEKLAIKKAFDDNEKKIYKNRVQKNTKMPVITGEDIKKYRIGRGGGKKIRKHKGINQTTGRLKKGYKYSDKKLKSGLKQIVKV